MPFLFWVLGVFNILTAVSCWASSVDTLPMGINSTSVRMGIMTGIDQRFADDGQLWRIGDYKSVQFTAENLVRLNDRAQQLIEALNSFGGQELGNNINLGILKVDAQPEVRYYAPVYARGITERWTLGLGVPVVNYRNKISLSQSNSNLEYYRNRFSGLNPELDSAFNIDLVQEVRTILRDRGYKEIQNRNETFLGDIQLASLYRFQEKSQSGVLYSVTLTLPTGPKYNSDDLTALNVFGRTSLENKILLSQRFNQTIEFSPYFSYLYNLPDQIGVRVPKNEDDALPDQSSKELVRRRLGGASTVGGDVILYLNDQFSIGGGYSVTEKSRDQFSGNEGRRYDLLSENTQSRSQKINAQLNFSTVQTYLRKISFMPAIISYSFQDMIAGVNAERRTVNELTLMMFF